MATGKVKKHQHVVPRTYLRGWADAEDHIAVLDRGTTTARRLAVSNSAVRRRFYNFAGTDGAETDIVETWLADHIEAPVGVTLAALRSGAELGDVEKLTVVNFTVAQLIRTPTVFGYLDHFDDHLGAMLVLLEASKSEELDLLALSDSERARYLRIARQAWVGLQNDQDTRASKLRTMIRTLDEVATQVTSWHWAVLTAPGPTLISGDSPVVTLNPTGTHWNGLIPSGSPLWMPLSPTRLLVAEPVKPLKAETTLTPEVASVVTRTLARQADHALFNDPEQPWPDLQFPKPKPQLPDPTVAWGRSTGKPTFPAQYPPVVSAEVKALLKKLGAIDGVE